MRRCVEMMSTAREPLFVQIGIALGPAVVGFYGFDDPFACAPRRRARAPRPHPPPVRGRRA